MFLKATVLYFSIIECIRSICKWHCDVKLCNVWYSSIALVKAIIFTLQFSQVQKAMESVKKNFSYIDLDKWIFYNEIIPSSQRSTFLTKKIFMFFAVHCNVTYGSMLKLNFIFL